jgi:hypothetical protein
MIARLMREGTSMRSSAALRRQIAGVASLALLATLVATFVSGIMAANQDPIIAASHRYCSYLLMGLAGGHVFLYRRSVTGQLRRWLLEATGLTSSGAMRRPVPSPRSLSREETA